MFRIRQRCMMHSGCPFGTHNLFCWLLTCIEHDICTLWNEVVFFQTCVDFSQLTASRPERIMLMASILTRISASTGSIHASQKEDNTYEVMIKRKSFLDPRCHPSLPEPRYRKLEQNVCFRTFVITVSKCSCTCIPTISIKIFHSLISCSNQ